MKVIFCAHDAPNKVGGPNTWIRRLLPALREYDVQPKALFLTRGQPRECPTVQALRKRGIECRGVQWPAYTGQQIRWILDRVAEDPPDVFVPNLSVAAHYASRWVREAGIPTVGVLHSDDAFHYGLLSEFVFGATSYQLSTLVCVSRFLEQMVLERNPPSTRICRVPCGVPLPDEVAQKPDGRLGLVYVGRLVERQKRISEVTRAFCQVVRAVPTCEAVIYGDGPARPQVEEILHTEGEGLPVRLAGRVDSEEIQDHMRQSHALVLLSDYEGLPIALMEAMACGVVPICLRVRSGIPELVEDGVTGLLVDDRQRGFVDAVRRLREEQGLWEQLSRAARSQIEAGYSSEQSAARWAEMLHELCEESARDRRLNLPLHVEVELPPVHPALAHEDQRTPGSLRRAYRYGRQLAGRAKRWLLGIRHV